MMKRRELRREQVKLAVKSTHEAEMRILCKTGCCLLYGEAIFYSKDEKEEKFLSINALSFEFGTRVRLPLALCFLKNQ
jgi:hypothetical protein